MLIRKVKKEDYLTIDKLGNLLHDNFNYNQDEFTSCLVCEDNDKVVGFIIYMKIYERAEIVDIIVDPLFRKKGYGYELLKNAINDISLSNCDNITLEVNCNNISAIALYKKMNFEIVAVRKKYYDNEDGYLMKKDLR